MAASLSVPALTPPASRSQTRRIVIPALVIAAAVLLAWSNSFSGPFVFDDRPAILANPTLENLSDALSPPRDGGTVAGRPLVNLTFALNRAFGGTAVAGYHAANLFIHLLAALTLFGIIRRTLSLPTAKCQRPEFAGSIAFAAALLWAVHPLQTAAVTYVVQRAESLMALCILLTLYGFVRAIEAAAAAAPKRAAFFFGASILACFAGMAAKEVMVVAPLVVLLYDRTFVVGTFAAAWRARWRYYLALAASWLPLAWLVATNAARAGTAGFDGKIAPLDYAFTQCSAIVRYLALALWPQGLVFDYGTPVVTAFTTIWPQALLLVASIAVTLFALRRAPALGFLGTVFFLILAPSSSVVPVNTQTIAEHRVYLPLAAVAVGIAVTLHRLPRRVATLAALGLAVPLAIATYQRNADYRDALTLWSDTAQKRPDNSRAHNNAGNEFARAGRTAEAIAHFEAALRLAPNDAEARNNLGNALTRAGRAPEALPHYEASVRLKPDSAPARRNLAAALVGAGRLPDAIAHYEAAEKLAPLDADAHNGLGGALAATGRAADALAHYEQALRLNPDHAQAHYNLGLALVRTRRFSAAIDHFRAATRLEPANVAARVNLGNALLVSNQPRSAIDEYEAALKLKPDDPQIRANLAQARALVR